MLPRAAEAQAVIRRWNEQLAASRDMLWSPTIRAALIAGTPWLDVFCPGCGTSRAIDLRKVDRHPLASVATLVLGLRCSWCPESAPMPKDPRIARAPARGEGRGVESMIRSGLRCGEGWCAPARATGLVRPPEPGALRCGPGVAPTAVRAFPKLLRRDRFPRCGYADCKSWRSSH
jgi:hypothetical protein